MKSISKSNLKSLKTHKSWNLNWKIQSWVAFLFLTSQQPETGSVFLKTFQTFWPIQTVDISSQDSFQDFNILSNLFSSLKRRQQF